MPESRLVTFRLTDEEMDALDAIVRAGWASDRTDALRTALRLAPSGMAVEMAGKIGHLREQLDKIVAELAKVEVRSQSTTARILGDGTVLPRPSALSAVPSRIGAPARIEVKPEHIEITTGHDTEFEARVRDEVGQVIRPAELTWTVRPAKLGSVRPMKTRPDGFIFSAGTLGGAGKITSRVGSIVREIPLHVFRSTGRIGERQAPR